MHGTSRAGPAAPTCLPRAPILLGEEPPASWAAQCLHPPPLGLAHLPEAEAGEHRAAQTAWLLGSEVTGFIHREWRTLQSPLCGTSGSLTAQCALTTPRAPSRDFVTSDPASGRRCLELQPRTQQLDRVSGRSVSNRRIHTLDFSRATPGSRPSHLLSSPRPAPQAVPICPPRPGRGGQRCREEPATPSGSTVALGPPPLALRRVGGRDCGKTLGRKTSRRRTGPAHTCQWNARPSDLLF
ncbi:PREDICTED: uncharacterized protein LOC102242995 [Myotis brandtii]|uniref:uncharacterized protein LOC102242995 n=1 Tax=Myotis brandtii TaxID=109478 RepID=UPI0007041D6A|nr:PREDICTED: uncharacterized protein LOC102242995 [Myotis brandtii]